jgi:hypothetical protein
VDICLTRAQGGGGESGGEGGEGGGEGGGGEGEGGGGEGGSGAAQAETVVIGPIRTWDMEVPSGAE